MAAGRPDVYRVAPLMHSTWELAMTDAPRSQLTFLTLVVFTFTMAAMTITFVLTLNWAFLGGALVAAAVVAWSGKRVIA
jgi:hypothetical protein